MALAGGGVVAPTTAIDAMPTREVKALLIDSRREEQIVVTDDDGGGGEGYWKPWTATREDVTVATRMRT